MTGSQHPKPKHEYIYIYIRFGLRLRASQKHTKEGCQPPNIDLFPRLRASGARQAARASRETPGNPHATPALSRPEGCNHLGARELRENPAQNYCGVT